MLVKVLGALDLLAGAILALSILTEIQFYVLVVLGIAVLVKSFIGFPKDFGAWIDFLTAVVLILAAFVTVPAVVKIVLALLIFQKGVASFL